MKKIIILTLTLLFLSACSNPNLMYDGIERPKEEVEELIENQLELQNPTYDLDVTIIDELQ